MEVISGLLDLQARSSGNPELIEMFNKSQSESDPWPWSMNNFTLQRI